MTVVELLRPRPSSKVTIAVPKFVSLHFIFEELPGLETVTIELFELIHVEVCGTLSMKLTVLLYIAP